MTPCEQARRWLPAHALGELEEAERAALSEHLAACEACRREEARVAQALSALRAMPELPPSAMRRERALAAARDLGPARRRRWPWVAAVAAVLLAGVLVRNVIRRPEPFTLRVEGVQGVVELERGGTWVPVATGAPVGEGSRVRTAMGRATLRSVRGDLVVLDVDSELSVEATTDREEGLLLSTGRLWCEATKREGRMLVIRTPAGRVEVVGTKFEVTYR